MRFFRAKPERPPDGARSRGVGADFAPARGFAEYQDQRNAQSIAVLSERSALPELNPGDAQPVKITVTRYQWWDNRSPGRQSTLCRI
jgi:hypothetical protein